MTQKTYNNTVNYLADLVAKCASETMVECEGFTGEPQVSLPDVPFTNEKGEVNYINTVFNGMEIENVYIHNSNGVYLPNLSKAVCDAVFHKHLVFYNQDELWYYLYADLYKHGE